MTAVDFIERAGHVAVEASNADEAIRILETRTDIQVVFSDVNMPGSMDGLMLIRLIRKRWPPIALILTSGKGFPAATALPENTRFLFKPYEFRRPSEAIPWRFDQLPD